tara:strand:- start:473 stop:724 length:252 start_codon:yes stop_codon:yes gene_type:complete
VTIHYIESEHGMDEAIESTVKLAGRIKGKKKLTFGFPSETLSQIFIHNLVASLEEAGLPVQNNLEINIVLPKEDLDDEEPEAI